jgi:hypothetical protein
MSADQPNNPQTARKVGEDDPIYRIRQARMDGRDWMVARKVSTYR